MADGWRQKVRRKKLLFVLLATQLSVPVIFVGDGELEGQRYLPAILKVVNGQSSGVRSGSFILLFILIKSDSPCCFISSKKGSEK